MLGWSHTPRTHEWHTRHSSGRYASLEIQLTRQKAAEKANFQWEGSNTINFVLPIPPIGKLEEPESVLCWNRYFKYAGTIVFTSIIGRSMPMVSSYKLDAKRHAQPSNFAIFLTGQAYIILLVWRCNMARIKTLFCDACYVIISNGQFLQVGISCFWVRRLWHEQQMLDCRNKNASKRHKLYPFSVSRWDASNHICASASTINLYIIDK